MKLTRIDYSQLNSRQQEAFNFQKVAGLLADYGFNCIKLADDWQGADFLAYHKDGNTTLKVQLKSRLTIDKKYMDKDIHVAFPVGESWYCLEHDELVAVVGEKTKWLESQSWQIQGAYSSASPGAQLLNALAQWKL